MNTQVMKLLQEATEWRLIALLFESPGDAWRRQIEHLASGVSDPTLRESVAAAKGEASSPLYHSTFGPGGPAAPREVSYCNHVLPGQVLGEVSGYYAAFAYDPRVGESPDHVAVECGFVAYLRLKQAYALERGDADQAQVCADAAQQFLSDHLSQVAEPLASSLQASGIPYLSHAAAALLERVGPRKPVPALTNPEPASCAAEGGCVWTDEETS